jgi:hypothetical protein
MRPRAFLVWATRALPAALALAACSGGNYEFPDTQFPDTGDSVASSATSTGGAGGGTGVADGASGGASNDDASMIEASTETSFLDQSIVADQMSVGDQAIVGDETFVASAAIACNDRNTHCSAGTSRCCRVNDVAQPDFCFGGPGEPGNCSSPVASTVSVECDDPSDCVRWGKPGTVCCAQGARLDPGGFETWSQVICVPPADCHPPTDWIFCDPSIANQCPAGQACVKPAELYMACQ